MPSVAYLGVTSKCNFSCKHCYLLPHQKNQDMALDDVLSLLKKLYDIGIIKLVYTHGEFFLNKNWKTILEEAKKLDFVQNILTNGLLLTNEICRVIEENKVQKIILSLDSSDPKIHCENRNNPKAWDGLKRGVELLKEHTNSIIGLNSVIADWTGDELLKMYDIASEWDVHELRFLPYHPPEGGQNHEDLRDIAKKFIELIDYAKGKKCRIFLHDPVLSAHLKRMDHALGDDKCSAGLDYLSIHTNGDVFPCNFLPVKLGNVFKMDIKSIDRNAEEFVRKSAKETEELCGDCSLSSLCQGGCLAFRHQNKTKCTRYQGE